MKKLVLVVLGLAVLVGCDDKKTNPTGSSGAPSASATTAATTTASASASASAAASTSATPSASAASSAQTSTKDVVVTVKDPATDKERTVKCEPNGTVTVYLPQEAGMSWAVEPENKALGKAKEQTIPGFAGPAVPAKELKWTLSGLKAGATQKATIVQKNKDKKPTGVSFVLTIEVVAAS